MQFFKGFLLNPFAKINQWIFIFLFGILFISPTTLQRTVSFRKELGALFSSKSTEHRGINEEASSNYVTEVYFCKIVVIEIFTKFRKSSICPCDISHALANLGVCGGVRVRSHASYYKDCDTGTNQY